MASDLVNGGAAATAAPVIDEIKEPILTNSGAEKPPESNGEATHKGNPSDATKPSTGSAESQSQNAGESNKPDAEKAEPNPEESKSKSAIGEKHDRDDVAEEPAAKKQKSETEKQNAAGEKESKGADKAAPDSKPATAGTAETNGNGEQKRRPGRPKKGEGRGQTTQKKAPTPRSTDGVGSRTRSRAT